MFCYTSMSDEHLLMHKLETDLKPFMMDSLCNPCKRYSLENPGPEVIKLFSFSTQLSMKCFLLINVKTANNCWHFNIYEQEK